MSKNKTIVLYLVLFICAIAEVLIYLKTSNTTNLFLGIGSVVVLFLYLLEEIANRMYMASTPFDDRYYQKKSSAVKKLRFLIFIATVILLFTYLKTIFIF